MARYRANSEDENEAPGVAFVTLAPPERHLRGPSLEQYAQGVSRYPLPDPPSVRHLFREARRGDGAALQEIVNVHLRFVVDVARTRRDCGTSLTQLIAAGNDGLVEAVQRFDPDRDGRFRDYALEWIRQEMTDSLDVT